jgi:iron(III) transport system ATP-binding protein
MARLSIEGAVKRFGQKTAIDRVSLEARDGEFVALLGPSGCGKSTLLRLVAGFERMDAGAIRFDGRTVSGEGAHVPTERRRLGMVFQSYALWPHMTVAQNVAFALEVQGLDAESRRSRVERALATVGLAGFGARRPDGLSGGQRQRVALARTLAAKPGIVLLDEPLANLDANLREAMQDEFRRFHRESGATLLFVTHDQAEALALADRVAVMIDGRLRQVDAPAALYDRPADAEVARFIGRGAVVPVQCVAAGADWAEVVLAGARLRLRAGPDAAPGPAAAALRPDRLRVAPYGDGHGLPARVEHVRFTGPSRLVTLALEDEAASRVQATAGREAELAPGDRVRVVVEDGWLLPRRNGR